MGSDRTEHRFLLRAAELLHAYGTPAHRLERVLAKMADALGVEAAFLVTPTGVQASFGSGAQEQVRLLRIEPGEVNLGKLVEFDRVLEDVEHGRASAEEGIRGLEHVAAAAPRYYALVRSLGFGLVSACAARLFGGGVPELAASFALGLGIFGLARLLPRRPSSVELFEPLAAFLAAFLSLLVARAVPLDDRVVTLASLIVLIPGLTLTTAMTELATRHLVSGVARLAGAGAVFLTLLLGVALAWKLGGFLPEGPAPRPAEARFWTEVAVVFLAPIGFSVVFDARPREVPAILLVSVAGYFVTRASAPALGTDLAAFLGALTVGVSSNVYARLCDHPALVPQTPGILLLVPGSLGYRSLVSFLERDSLEGMEWAFQTGLVAVSLVGGLLTANALAPPRRVL